MSAAEPLFDVGEENTGPAECVAFVNDNQTHGVIASVLAQHFENPVVRDGDSRQALEFLSEAPTPKILIVDIGDSTAPLTVMLGLTAAFSEDIKLIGIGTINDISLYRELIEAGINDYLVKPVTEKALIAALTRTPESPATTEQKEKETNKRIVVVGSRGGVGASSVAVNLAWILAEEQKQRTALVDLDLEFGTIALALDLEPTRGLREALENPARIDSLFISSATAKLSEHLSVMATEETLTGDVEFNPGAIDVLLESLGRNNDSIVIDLPRTAFSLRRRTLSLATEIVIVTELSLPGLRDSIRLLSTIEEVAPETPITVISNRSVGGEQAMKVGDFQKALGHKVDLQIPENRKVFNQAANTGKPVVQAGGKSSAGKALRKMASKFYIARKDSKKGVRPWRGLFKKS